MRSNGVQIVHRFTDIVPPGKAVNNNEPFYLSNLEISKSVPGLSGLFSNGIKNPNKEITRSLDGDEVHIPVVLKQKEKTRNFTISLRTIAEDQCHIEIKEHFDRSPSKTILNEASIIHNKQDHRYSEEDNKLVSHLRREIEGLNNARLFRETRLAEAKAQRKLAASMAMPNDSIQTGGLRIDGSNPKVRDFSSKPKKEYMSKGGVRIYAQEHTVGKVLSSKKVLKIHVTKNSVGKVVKVLRPQMPNTAEQTIKFKLSNPTENAADLTVVDKSGKELLSKVKITVNRSVTPSRDHKVAHALHNAVLDLTA